MLPRLVQVAPNVIRLVMDETTVVFSYETPLALCAPGIGWVVNRDCTEYSRTSAKHRTQLGLKERPHLAEALFTTLVESALALDTTRPGSADVLVRLYTEGQTRHVA